MDISALARLPRCLGEASADLAGQRRRSQDDRSWLLEHAEWLKPGDRLPLSRTQRVGHRAIAMIPAAVVAEATKAMKTEWWGKGRPTRDHSVKDPIVLLASVEAGKHRLPGGTWMVASTGRTIGSV